MTMFLILKYTTKFYSRVILNITTGTHSDAAPFICGQRGQVWPLGCVWKHNLKRVLEGLEPQVSGGNGWIVQQQK